MTKMIIVWRMTARFSEFSRKYDAVYGDQIISAFDSSRFEVAQLVMW